MGVNEPLYVQLVFKTMAFFGRNLSFRKKSITKVTLPSVPLFHPKQNDMTLKIGPSI
jgi:hypothetical protein